MNGKYFGVYDIKDGDICVGVFESINEICAFFEITNRNRIECSICRKNPLAFKEKRYRVEVFLTYTEFGFRRLMRQRFGHKNYMLNRKDGNVYIRDMAKENWVWVHYASNMDEAVEKCSEELMRKRGTAQGACKRD